MLKKTFVTVFLILLWMGTVASKPQGLPQTGDPAWDAFIKAQDQWVEELHDLVTEARPDLKEIADISSQWRKAEMELSSRKFSFIQKHHPDTIERDKGLPAFIKLEWFPEFSEKLTKTDPSFSTLEAKVADLKKKNDAHPQWPSLQDYLKSVQKSDEHRDKFDRFMGDMKKVQKVLALTAAEAMRKAK